VRSSRAGRPAPTSDEVRDMANREIVKRRGSYPWRSFPQAACCTTLTNTSSSPGHVPGTRRARRQGRRLEALCRPSRRGSGFRRHRRGRLRRKGGAHVRGGPVQCLARLGGPRACKRHYRLRRRRAPHRRTAEHWRPRGAAPAGSGEPGAPALAQRSKVRAVAVNREAGKLTYTSRCAGSVRRRVRETALLERRLPRRALAGTIRAAVAVDTALL